MANLSSRITQISPGGDDGWDVFRKAQSLKAAGEPIIDLTIGEHDVRTDPSILAAMDASARGGHTGYSAIPGIEALRSKLATRIETRTGVPTTSRNIIVMPGGQASLFAAHLAVTDPGQSALFIDPYYATYPGTIRAAGAIPRRVPARPEDGFQPDARLLGQAALGAKSLLINTPNNPTGAVYTKQTLLGIAEVCHDHDLWLISDEVYDTQVWNGIHRSPRALEGMAERTLVCGSLSKSHAMTGSRLGWICGPEDAIDELFNLSTNTTYGQPGFIQDAGLFALQQGEDFEAKIAAPFKRRREIALELLAKQNRFQAIPPDGAMYIMIDIRPTGMSGEAFANALLDTHKIAVMPGESFGHSAAGHIRIAMTVADDRFAQAIKTLLSFQP